MPAGSKIQDTNQDERYQQVQVWPDGSSFEVYSTPDNQRLAVTHSSGSRIEFKADGTVFIKAIKDLHMNSSVASSQSDSIKGSDTTTQRIDTNLVMEIDGRLNIKCSEFNMEVGSTARVNAGTDMTLTCNNLIEKATESISMQGQKSIYVDTKEMKERVVFKDAEVGTDEDTGQGGLSVLNVYGNALIQNKDVNGGITIAAAGYLNLMCGAERVDVIGKYVPDGTCLPFAVGTFTTQVFTPTVASPQNKSIMPGDYVFNSQAGASYTYALTAPGSSVVPAAGLNEVVTLGNHLHTVAVGNQVATVAAGNRVRTVGLNETVTIGGIQKVTAAQIYLN